jgi:hypothetical protein
MMFWLESFQVATISGAANFPQDNRVRAYCITVLQDLGVEEWRRMSAMLLA